VQFQDHIAGRMGQVPTHHGACRFSGCRNGRHIKNLSVIIIHSPNKNQGQAFPQFVNFSNDIFRAPGMLPRALFNLHNRISRIQSMNAHLAVQHILV